MSITLWVLFSLTAIFITLYIVGFAKKINFLRNTSSALLLPVIGTSNIFLLAGLLPDSFHTIIITGIAYFSASAALVLSLFENKKGLETLTKTSFLISMITWIHLYFSAFYIYRISNVLIICGVIFFGLISTAVCIISGKQKIHSYIHTVIGVYTSGLLCLLAFVFLLYGKTISAALLSAGALVNTALVIFYILNSCKYNYKLGKLVNLLLLIASQVLISYSNLLLLK